MKLFVVPLILMLTGITDAQKPEKFACSKADEETVKQYFNDRQENDKVLKDLFTVFNSRKPRLSFCWAGCAVSLPLPRYPYIARKYGVGGIVTVETITKEDGKIIFAKAIDGPPLLRHSAQQAACLSGFKPILFDQKPIKFRWNIVYNFVL